MEPTFEIYLYGMIVRTTAHLLKDRYPDVDGYGEIVETHRFAGGETGAAAVLLASWGNRIVVGGPFLGNETREPILGLLGERGIDCSKLEFDPEFDGVEDLVLVAGTTRTVFGSFGGYFSAAKKRWSRPDEESIMHASVVGVDPFFGAESEEVADMCRAHGRPWVTIDCPPESPLHTGSAVTVVSAEYLRDHNRNDDPRELLRAYADMGAGLTIFTFGAKEILFARRKEPIRSTPAYVVPVKSTLGAGDSFKAAVIHAVACGQTDQELVGFAAATAACVCTRFPMASDPPGLAEIHALCRGSHY
ncbi:MAG: PfkB family carbohydrate kinase [Fimbriimonas sp.]|nr:PfkB family carbohydrate kinase [Fimbriimonas sp.]